MTRSAPVREQPVSEELAVERQTAPRTGLLPRLVVVGPSNTPGIRRVLRLALTKNPSLSIAVRFHHGLSEAEDPNGAGTSGETGGEERAEKTPSRHGLTCATDR
jgi:hypothetical protein